MAFYARCITTPFPSLLITSPRSTLRLFRNKSQSSSLSLSLYTDTNKRIFVFDSSPAGGECESSRAERFAVHSTLLALRMGTMGARGKRGPPFDTIHRKRQKEGNGGAIGGGDCVARIANYRFRFFREFLLSSLAERGEHWMNFSNLS